MLPEPFNYEVTCHTENCENGEITIPVISPDMDFNVVCGVCGQEITDIKKL